MTGAARSVAALAMAVVALAGCSDQEAKSAVDDARDGVNSAIDKVDLPEVDWSQYDAKLHDRIDRLAEQADCSKLQELAQAEANDTDLTSYLKAKLRQLDC